MAAEVDVANAVLPLGGLLVFAGVYRQSERFSCSWKAWDTSSAGKLKWELRRILPGLFFEESKKRPVCQFIRQNFVEWADLLERVCLVPWTDHLGRSMRSDLRRNGAGGDQELEQEAWCSTEALVVLLIDARQKARALDRRAHTWAVSKQFADLVLDGQRCRQREWATPGVDIVDACSKGAGFERALFPSIGKGVGGCVPPLPASFTPFIHPHRAMLLWGGLSRPPLLCKQLV